MRCFGNVPYGDTGKTFIIDANGDGLPDIVRLSSAEVSLFLNTGNESFAAPFSITGKIPGPDMRGCMGHIQTDVFCL